MFFQYTYNSVRATWQARDEPLENHSSELHSLGKITFHNGLMENNLALEQNPFMHNLNLIGPVSDDSIEIATSMANNMPNYVFQNLDFRYEPPLDIPKKYQDLIWFIIPRQVILQISYDYEINTLKNRPLFHPRLDDQYEDRTTE